MKLLIVAATLVVVSVAVAENESPNPSPSVREESQPVQDSGTNQDQETRPPDTESKNLSTLDDPQHSAVGSKQDVQGSSNQAGNQPSDDRLVWLTGDCCS